MLVKFSVVQARLLANISTVVWRPFKVSRSQESLVSDSQRRRHKFNSLAKTGYDSEAATTAR